jgi:hypothetical protein
MTKCVSLRPWIANGTFLLALFAAIGCGGSGGVPVKGKVTFNGKPVVWGGVTLVDALGQYHQGLIELDGTYKIDDLVPVGGVKIAVVSRKPRDESGKGGKAAADGTAGNSDDPREKFMKSQGITPTAARPNPPAGAWFAIPEKYADPMKSDLTGMVKKGVDLDIDIDLK